MLLQHCTSEDSFHAADGWFNFTYQSMAAQETGMGEYKANYTRQI